jgi:AraC-like DNA-binding protein
MGSSFTTRIQAHPAAPPSRIHPIDGALFIRRFAQVTATFERRHDVAVPLKRVLLLALRQQCGDGAPLLIRTARRMASATGYSPGYISRLSSAAGIPLGRVIDLCLALRALELVHCGGCSVGEAARRLGSARASSLSSFIARALGARPSRIAARDVERSFDELEALLQGSLQSRW